MLACFLVFLALFMNDTERITSILPRPRARSRGFHLPLTSPSTLLTPWPMLTHPPNDTSQHAGGRGSTSRSDLGKHEKEQRDKPYDH